MLEKTREQADDLVQSALGLLALWDRHVSESRAELAAERCKLNASIATIARMRDTHGAEQAEMARRVAEAEERASKGARRKPKPYTCAPHTLTPNPELKRSYAARGG